MATTIRISVDIPDHGKIIKGGLTKNSVIDKVDVVFSSNSCTVTCTYDEKKHSAIDKYKLERELKGIIAGLGYKAR